MSLPDCYKLLSTQGGQALPSALASLCPCHSPSATLAYWLFLQEDSGPLLLLVFIYLFIHSFIYSFTYLFFQSGTLLPQVSAWPATLDIQCQCFGCPLLLDCPSEAVPCHCLFPYNPGLFPSEPKHTLFAGSSVYHLSPTGFGSPKEKAPHQALPRSQVPAAFLSAFHDCSSPWGYSVQCKAGPLHGPVTRLLLEQWAAHF